MPASRITPLAKPSSTRVWTAMICPFAQLLNIALAEKQVEHESVEVDLQNKSKEFLEVSSVGKVPVLEDAGHVLTESTILMEYVDETWETPGKRLLPKDTALRAKVRVQCERIRNLAYGPFFKCLYALNEKEKLEFFDKLVASFVELVSGFDNKGPFIFGEEFSMADIQLAPFRQRLVVLEKLFGLTFPPKEELKRLDKWWDVVRTHPSFVATKPDDAFLVEAYKKSAERRAKEAQLQRKN